MAWHVQSKIPRQMEGNYTGDNDIFGDEHKEDCKAAARKVKATFHTMDFSHRIWIKREAF